MCFVILLVKLLLKSFFEFVKYVHDIAVKGRFMYLFCFENLTFGKNNFFLFFFDMFYFLFSL